MFSRKYRTHLLLVAGLVLGGSVPAHADTGDKEREPVIVAHGNGEVRVQPDSVRVDLGVDVQARTVEEARTQVSAAMQHVLDALHALDVPDLKINTSQVRFNPVYSTATEGQPAKITGFAASNHVLVTDEHASAGDLAARSARIVDAALDAGANDVGSIDFFVADTSSAEEQALTLAVQNAERDARTIAEAAGVTIVGPIRIEEGSAMAVPRMFAAPMAMRVSTPIEVGDITVQSDVTAKFTFR